MSPVIESVRRLDVTLGEVVGGLVATCLHGSAALGGFVPGHSDVDVLVVCHDEPLHPDELTAAAGALRAAAAPCPGRGLELSMVARRHALHPRPPWPFLLHVTTDPDCRDPARRTALGGDVTGGALAPAAADGETPAGTTLEQQRRRAQRRHVASRITVYVVAIVAALLAAFPFIVAGIITFKRDQDLYAPGKNPFVYNLDPTTEHLNFLFTDTGFVTFIGNTLVVGGCVVAITLLLGLPAAYSLARLPLRWGGALAITIFLVYLIPPSLLFVSFSRLIANLDLQDSKWALVVLYPTITLPVSVWLLLGFFKSIPRDIEEQAMVDGYSRFAAFWRVAVPLAFPGIVAVVVFAFTLSAHEFLYASAFVSSSAEKTVSVGIPTELVLGDVFHWQELLAAALLVALPIAFVFNLLLERFVSGFTMGAVKG